MVRVPSGVALQEVLKQSLVQGKANLPADLPQQEGQLWNIQYPLQEIVHVLYSVVEHDLSRVLYVTKQGISRELKYYLLVGMAITSSSDTSSSSSSPEELLDLSSNKACLDCL